MNKNKLNILLSVLSLLTLFSLASAPAFAASKKDLQAKFEKRFPQILEYKRDGKVGENVDGYIEAVKSDYLSDKTLSRLIDDENADRKDLYRLIADDEKTTVTKVAEAAAKRNFEKARAGEYLKGADGKWKKK